ncbi:MAG: RNB domain-containing ribonuclease [Desulfobacteraceae bacterium]|jgi:exoribonuclease-2
MNEGKIVEYIDQGRFICTLCLQDKGNRLHLLTPFNRQVNLSPKRALLISKASMGTLGPREELLSRLKQTEELRRRLREEVQVKELWELVREEEQSFDYEYLAQLCFGEMVTDDHISALVRALFEDRLYFKMKDGRFLPHSEEMVDQIIKQKKEEARREERLREGSAWLIEILQNRVVHDPSCKEEIIDLLVELALYGNEAPNFKYGKELLLRTGISDVQRARKLLVKLGVWEEDENLDLFRLDLRTSFSQEVLDLSDELVGVAFKEPKREDLRHLHTFTIDGPLTRDFDDALSIEIKSDSILLGIHISDVAQVISPNSLLDGEALQRGSSLYLPRRHIPMIPQNLSQGTLSLREGCDRHAISLISRLDKSGNLLDYRFALSLVNVKRQLTYDQVNEIYMKESLLEEAHQLSQFMRQKRIDLGSLTLSLPELYVRFYPNSSLYLEMVEQNTPSRMMVAEFMIFYNWLAARFCRDNKIPVLYRGQEGPSERLSINEAGYLYFVFKQRRKLNPLMIDTEPRCHTGLGLDVYTNASSPIRRYLDLVVQRQIRGYLIDGSPIYDKEELEDIRISVGPILRDLGRVKRNRNRYWIQKYLLQHKEEKFSALVLDVLRGRCRILLTDFLLVAEMKRDNGQEFFEGQQILVTVKKSDPWNDLLSLEYAAS